MDTLVGTLSKKEKRHITVEQRELKHQDQCQSEATHQEEHHHMPQSAGLVSSGHPGLGLTVSVTCYPSWWVQRFL